jgi:osmotically-inducible protein OsmY
LRRATLLADAKGQLAQYFICLDLDVITIPMKTDLEIQSDIIDELRWEAGIDLKQIEVSAKGGHVTLSGVVDTYPKKMEAERAALRVHGVIWVSNDLRVELLEKRSDSEIRESVIKAIAWNSAIENNQIEVNVENGWVTLEGQVEWEFQKTKAKNLTDDIAGVVGVSNFINVAPSFVMKK